MAPTVPGQGLGLYACGYHTLARIAALHADARVALLDGQFKVGSSAWSPQPLETFLFTSLGSKGFIQGMFLTIFRSGQGLRC